MLERRWTRPRPLVADRLAIAQARALACSLASALVGALAVALCAPLPARAAEEAPLDLRFAQLFRQPIGPRGLEIGPQWHAADGRLVRLTGFMVAQEQASAGRFLLSPRPARMSEHADGDASDLPPSAVTVLLDASQADRVVVHQDGLLSITGRLSVGRLEAPDGQVTWVRLQLPPQALANSPMSPLNPSSPTTGAAPHRH